MTNWNAKSSQGRQQTAYSARDKDLMGVDLGQKGPRELSGDPIVVLKPDFYGNPLGPKYDHSHETPQVCLLLLRPMPSSIPDLAHRYKLMTKKPILYQTLTKILLQAANEGLCRHSREFEGEYTNHFFRLNKADLKKKT